MKAQPWPAPGNRPALQQHGNLSVLRMLLRFKIKSSHAEHGRLRALFGRTNAAVLLCKACARCVTSSEQ